MKSALFPHVLHHMQSYIPCVSLFFLQSNLYAYGSLTSSMLSIVRAGPSELFRRFLASSLRDAPYTSLFLVFYEANKRDAASMMPPSSLLICAGLNGGSGFVQRTACTYPFDREGMQLRHKRQILWPDPDISWLCGKSVPLSSVLFRF